MNFQGKIALVTGSSRGIGKATALEFAKHGADVVINCSSSIQEAEVVVDEVRAMGRRALLVQADVSREANVRSMIEKCVSEMGGLDILVNNAGIVVDVPLEERTVDQWTKTLAVNLIGPFLCAREAAKVMRERGSGVIVNVASTNGIDNFSPEAIDYDSSKAGVLIMTRNLAKEFAPMIRVNAVAPGWVKTAMNAELPKDFLEEEISKIYLKRIAEPEEIAKVIAFIASDDASFMTGAVIKVDGGYGQ
jgi:3-oxoacyl-[acyl-carrier protein] reductase